jgi:hypothetical protein
MASGVKRSLFSKPSWAATSAKLDSADNEKQSIFSQNLAYQEIVKAQKAERERKAAKAKAHQDEGPENKRRRISTEAEDQDESDKDVATPEKHVEKTAARSTPNKVQKFKKGSKRSPKASLSPRSKRKGKATVIDLDGDSDDDLVTLTLPQPNQLQNAKESASEDSDDEDDYLRQLKAKAREKARLHQEQGSHPETKLQSPLSRSGSTALDDYHARSASTPQEPSQPTSSTSNAPAGSSGSPRPVQDDPELKIMIQSSIPGTNALVVKRKASQSLRQVKEFWCKRFNLPASLAAQVFFTWNDTHLFDSTTMRGVLKNLKQHKWEKDRQASRSRNLQQGNEWDEDEDEENGVFDERKVKDPSNGHILLEATTKEIFEAKIAAKEKREREADTNASTEDESNEADAGGGSGSAAVAAQKEPSLKIRLVAKNLEPMQLVVRPSTQIERIMRGFAKTRDVEQGQTAWLIFEGERLDPHSTVEEVGFEDEDEVEVSIR